MNASSEPSPPPTDPSTKRKRVEGLDNGGFDDSDDKQDKLTSPPKANAPADSSTPFHTIEVTAPSHSTFLATLGWI